MRISDWSSDVCSSDLQIVNDSSFTVRTMGWFVLATVPITIAIAVLSIREGKAPSQVHEAKLRDYLGLFSLRPTRLLLAVQLFIGLALGIRAAVFLFLFILLIAVPFSDVGLPFFWFFRSEEDRVGKEC